MGCRGEEAQKESAADKAAMETPELQVGTFTQGSGEKGKREHTRVALVAARDAASNTDGATANVHGDIPAASLSVRPPPGMDTENRTDATHIVQTTLKRLTSVV